MGENGGVTSRTLSTWPHNVSFKICFYLGDIETEKRNKI